MIQPMDVVVLVKPESVKEKTEGGLYVPDSTRQRDQLNCIRGEIVAIGDGAWGDMLGEKKPQIGDTVIFAKLGGLVVEDLDKTLYRLLYDKDILAIIRENGEE